MHKRKGFISPADITLERGGIFQKSAETGLEYVKSVDVDRLLAPSYEMHGITPPNNAVRYGGWERKGANNWGESDDTFTLAGHSLGHWMSAAAAFYSECRDQTVLDMINYVVKKLDYLQRVTHSPYIGGCSEETFTKMFDGNSKWCEGYWVPWYGIHKIYQGLIDVYESTNSDTSFTVLKRFADWAADGISRLSYEEMQNTLNVEHGGMNEIFAVMHRYTGDEKYLKAAVSFTHDKILKPLFEGKDELAGLHANTQIPKIIGAASIYDETNDEYYRTVCMNFMDFIMNNRSYVIGGNSISEHFEVSGLESLGVKTCESCNTYNMMRLSEYLFKWEPDVRYMDYYENALYNHILGQQEPQTGEKMYFVSLLQGHHRVYENKYKSWWCCTGTGMENPARYTRCIYFENGDELYVNLYISNSVVWKSKGLSFEIKTDYPYGTSVKFRVTEGNAKATVKFRVPNWTDKMTSCADGKEYVCGGGKYLEINRVWKEGDVVDMEFPMKIHIYQSRNCNQIAFKYGAITLAGTFGGTDTKEGVREYISDETKIDTVTEDVPYITSRDADVSAVDESRLIFKIDGKYTSNNRDIILEPFYAVHHKFYNVYWNVNKDIDRFEKLLNDITIDKVEPDGQQDEIGHGLKTNTCSHIHQGLCENVDKPYMYRDAWGITDDNSNAYFSYRMNINDGDNFVCIGHCHSDKTFQYDGITYTYDFEILVDDIKIGEYVCEYKNNGKIEYIFYKIPADITDGKSSVTVKLMAKNNVSCATMAELRITSGIV